MSGPKPSPLQLAALARTATAYWESQVLFAANSLGVFEELSQQPATAQELAARVGARPESLRRLLHGCVAQRLLRRDDDGVFSLDAVGQLLVGDDSLGPWVSVMGRWYGPWGGLAEAVRSGTAVEDRWLRLRDDPGYVRDFIMGMHRYNAPVAADLADTVRLPEDRPVHLVDLGGGLGTFTAALCRRYPRLRVTLVDVDEVVGLAAKHLAEQGLQDRVAFHAADYFSTGYPSGVDAVLMSNILHQESDERAGVILAEARRHLAPGGMLVVNGHFLNDDETSPPFAVLHNLSALVLWDQGHSHTLSRMAQLIETAGFDVPQTHVLATKSDRLLVGWRPHEIHQPEAPR